MSYDVVLDLQSKLALEKVKLAEAKEHEAKAKAAEVACRRFNLAISELSHAVGLLAITGNQQATTEDVLNKANAVQAILRAVRRIDPKAEFPA